MKKLFFLIVFVVSGVFVSGCNTNSGELLNQALNSNISVVDSGAKQTEEISDAPVLGVHISGYGKVLTTKRFLPLYTNADDTSFGSTCYDECAIAWPPLIVNSADEVSGDYGVMERVSGDLQVTRQGKPLYSYTPDSNRKVTGDGFRDVWSVVILEEEVKEAEEAAPTEE